MKHPHVKKKSLNLPKKSAFKTLSLNLRSIQQGKSLKSLKKSAFKTLRLDLRSIKQRKSLNLPKKSAFKTLRQKSTFKTLYLLYNELEIFHYSAILSW